jgi:hypothetical protein
MNVKEAQDISGFPGQDLYRIVPQLEELADKAMPRVRGKGIYKSLAGRAS